MGYSDTYLSRPKNRPYSIIRLPAAATVRIFYLKYQPMNEMSARKLHINNSSVLEVVLPPDVRPLTVLAHVVDLEELRLGVVAIAVSHGLRS